MLVFRGVHLTSLLLHFLFGNFPSDAIEFERDPDEHPPDENGQLFPGDAFDHRSSTIVSGGGIGVFF